MKLLCFQFIFFFSFLSHAHLGSVDPQSSYNLAIQEMDFVLSGQAGEVCILESLSTKISSGEISCLELAFGIINMTLQAMMINIEDPSQLRYYISDLELVDQIKKSYEDWYEDTLKFCESNDLSRFKCLINEFKTKLEHELIPVIQRSAI